MQHANRNETTESRVKILLPLKWVCHSVGKLGSYVIADSLQVSAEMPGGVLSVGRQLIPLGVRREKWNERGNLQAFRARFTAGRVVSDRKALLYEFFEDHPCQPAPSDHRRSRYALARLSQGPFRNWSSAWYHRRV